MIQSIYPNSKSGFDTTTRIQLKREVTERDMH